MILAAGAYQSPVLLMLSGIGPAEDLALFGMPVRENLPVGRNLQDHCMVEPQLHDRRAGALRVFTPENFELLENEGRGPLSSNIPEAGGFFRTRDDLPAPDVEFHFAPSIFFDEGLNAPHRGRVRLRPGRDQAARAAAGVKLRTPMADSKPLVLSNFLTTEEDRRSMIDGRPDRARDRRRSRR